MGALCPSKYIKINCNINTNNIKNDTEFKKKYYLPININTNSRCNIICVNTPKNKYIINKKLLIEGLYDNYIIKIIKGRVNYNNLRKFKLLYINKINTNRGKSNPRTANRPIYKWYFKKYMNKVNNDYYNNDIT